MPSADAEPRDDSCREGNYLTDMTHKTKMPRKWWEHLREKYTNGICLPIYQK